MHPKLTHISHYLHRALQGSPETFPAVPLAICSLDLKRYRLFRNLVIPAQRNVTTLPWVLIRHDGVFLLEAFAPPPEPNQTLNRLHRQWNTLARKSEDLSTLLRRVDYDGRVQAVLVLPSRIDYTPVRDQAVVFVNHLHGWLDAYAFSRPIRKPGLALQLCQQIQQAMYGPRLRSCFPVHKLTGAPRFYWMRDFQPRPVYRAQRDFAFTPADKPQATRTRKEDPKP